MPMTITGQFSAKFANWLTAEGFSVTPERDGACLAVIDYSGTPWAVSLRAVTLECWTLVVVFDPEGSHEEVFYDFDAEPESVMNTLICQLRDIWSTDALV